MAIEQILGHMEMLIEYAAYWLLAYDASGGGRCAAALQDMFGIAETDCDYWERISECERTLAEKTRLEHERAPFEQVCAAFGLDGFERFALTMALVRETDERCTAAVRLLGEPALTLGFALRLYSGSPGEALAWRVQRLKDAEKLFLLYGGVTDKLDAPLAIRPCLLRFMLGADWGIDGVSIHHPGEELRALGPADDFPAEVLRILEGEGRERLFLLRGGKGSGKKHGMRRLSAASGKPVLFAAREAVASRSEDILAAHIVTGGYLCVCGVEAASDISVLAPLALRHIGSLFVTTTQRVSFPEYSAVEFHFAVPDTQTRRLIWNSLLGEHGYDTGLADDASSKYAFTAGAIESALYAADDLMYRSGQIKMTPRLLDEGCALQLPSSLNGLMKPVQAMFIWDDLVLPRASKKALMDACGRVKHANVVYDDWGLGKKLPYGRGLKILFSGPPGTGKTMAAQVMASELGMKLYKVSLPALVDKYVGETEKHLEKLFADAARSGGILFFDEADTLFGKRTEQSDSQGRFANMQTAFLLQAVEDYEGVLILATNLARNLDEAFTRRIQCRIDFFPPDEASRREMWTGLLNIGMPLDGDIDVDFLAHSFELTGAEIKNIVTSATFLGASEGGCVGMREITEALLAEYSKAGKVTPELGQFSQPT